MRTKLSGVAGSLSLAALSLLLTAASGPTRTQLNAPTPHPVKTLSQPLSPVASGSSPNCPTLSTVTLSVSAYKSFNLNYVAYITATPNLGSPPGQYIEQVIVSDGTGLATFTISINNNPSQSTNSEVEDAEASWYGASSANAPTYTIAGCQQSP
jgi:hypothetical protein